jgi:hypothetical protein
VQVNLIGLVVVGIWFRCRDLGNIPGINGDEAWYGVQAELVLRGQPIEWRTPTGNLLNPLFFGPQLLLHAMFEPSFTLLRATAVFSGLAALALNYWLCRCIFGRRVAAISTVILAVLPTDIVYSRLAWDASQSLFVTLLAVYLALRAVADPMKRTRWSAAALGAQALAIVVHPTNVFVAPLLAVCLAIAWWDELQRFVGHAVGAVANRNYRLKMRLTGGIFLATVISALVIVNSPRAQQACSRLIDPSAYFAFATNLWRLFSGATVYEYVSGAISPASEGVVRWDVVVCDLAAGLAFAFLAWGVYRRIGGRSRAKCQTTSDDVAERSRQNAAASGLTVGWGLSLLAFFLIAGPAAIAPHFERYGIGLLGPGAILAAIGLDAWLVGHARRAWADDARQRTIAIVPIILGWFVLAGFQFGFFGFFRQTGGESHATFRTAAVEPKAAALDFIIRHSHGPTHIAASEWWNYWPLRYLAMGRTIETGQGAIEVEFATAADSRCSDRSISVWQVEFTGSPAGEAIRQREHLMPTGTIETTIADYSGRPVLSAFQLPRQSENQRAVKESGNVGEKN